MASEQQHTSMLPTRYSQWFILVTAAFITCLITANITAVKLVGAFGLVLPAADGDTPQRADRSARRRSRPCWPRDGR